MKSDDPWDILPDHDRELPDDRGPSAWTIACFILAVIVTLGFACYGFYRIACWILNLAP